MRVGNDYAVTGFLNPPLWFLLFGAIPPLHSLIFKAKRNFAVTVSIEKLCARFWNTLPTFSDISYIVQVSNIFAINHNLAY